MAAPSPNRDEFVGRKRRSSRESAYQSSHEDHRPVPQEEGMIHYSNWREEEPNRRYQTPERRIRPRREGVQQQQCDDKFYSSSSSSSFQRRRVTPHPSHSRSSPLTPGESPSRPSRSQSQSPGKPKSDDELLLEVINRAFGESSPKHSSTTAVGHHHHSTSPIRYRSNPPDISLTPPSPSFSSISSPQSLSTSSPHRLRMTHPVSTSRMAHYMASQSPPRTTAGSSSVSHRPMELEPLSDENINATNVITPLFGTEKKMETNILLTKSLKLKTDSNLTTKKDDYNYDDDCDESRPQMKNTLDTNICSSDSKDVAKPYRHTPTPHTTLGSNQQQQQAHPFSQSKQPQHEQYSPKRATHIRRSSYPLQSRRDADPSESSSYLTFPGSESRPGYTIAQTHSATPTYHEQQHDESRPVYPQQHSSPTSPYAYPQQSTYPTQHSTTSYPQHQSIYPAQRSTPPYSQQHSTHASYPTQHPTPLYPQHQTQQYPPTYQYPHYPPYQYPYPHLPPYYPPYPPPTSPTPPPHSSRHYITSIRDTDVLCGRGGATNSHVGNRNFRSLVKKYQQEYLHAKKKDKPSVAAAVVEIVRKKEGRFLKKDKVTGFWLDIGDARAREKTSQALREGAPELRLKEREGEGKRDDVVITEERDHISSNDETNVVAVKEMSSSHTTTKDQQERRLENIEAEEVVQQERGPDEDDDDRRSSEESISDSREAVKKESSREKEKNKPSSSAFADKKGTTDKTTKPAEEFSMQEDDETLLRDFDPPRRPNSPKKKSL